MAFVASSLTNGLQRAWSVGPVKFEIKSFAAVSTDTSGSVTADYLHQIDQAVLLGGGTLCATSAPSISGATVTFTLADPASGATGYVAANVNGLILMIGR